MKSGSCVRILNEADGGARGRVLGVEYVQTPIGAAIQGGGSSFFWEEREFCHITDPILIAAANGHDALTGINAAKAALKKAQDDYSLWCKVVGVMVEAKGNK